jgi:hypothetical protein
MSAERMARLVARWVRFYTRDLPPAIAERRIDEIRADLHDHVAHERADGAEERRIALGIAGRMVRGLPADAAWRRHTIARHSTARELMKRSAVRVALVTACILLVPLVANLLTEGEGWSVADFVIAAILLVATGALLELAVRHPRNLVYQVAAVAIGAAAIVLGEGDDAPGLVLFGGLLILGTLALAVRTAQRSE